LAAQSQSRTFPGDFGHPRPSFRPEEPSPRSTSAPAGTVETECALSTHPRPGYCSAGCTPAEPTSSSPGNARLHLHVPLLKRLDPPTPTRMPNAAAWEIGDHRHLVAGQLSLRGVSHHWGLAVLPRISCEFNAIPIPRPRLPQPERVSERNS
jgi:hypothetical protein